MGIHRLSRGLEIGVFAAALVMLVARVPYLDHFLGDSDHGYQLAAGAELLRGRLPGVHSFSNYGPLVAVLSAATLWASGNLIAESLLCATAWAGAIWLAFRLTRRRFGPLPGWVAAISGALLVGRFHKWYTWLLPLAVLAVIDPENGRPTRRRWLAAGLLCGCGGLLRPEFGVAALAVSSVVALADSLRERGPSWPVGWMPLAAGFVLPVGVWIAIVACVAEPGGLARALRAIAESLVGSVRHWSKPPPPFRLDAPFSTESAHALALVLLPAIEVAALGFGGWLAYAAPHRALAREGRLLAAIGLMGVAFYPHAIYRAGFHHLLQGVWPLVVGVPALVSLAVRFARAAAHAGRRWTARTALAAAILVAVLAGAAFVPIAAEPHYDLTTFSYARWSGLAELRGDPAAVPGNPYAEVIATIVRASDPGDEVLVIPVAPQLLVFADRPSSGLSFVYQRGVFDSPEWRRARLALIESRPPRLVVASSSYFLTGDVEFRASEPELDAYVHAHYHTIVAVHANAGMMVLAHDPAPAPGADEK